MSLLIHRCRSCGHPDYAHGYAPDCSYGNCRCTPDFDPEPERIPTFHPTTHQVDDRPVEPGKVWHQNLKQCACDRCCELLAVSA